MTLTDMSMEENYSVSSKLLGTWRNASCCGLANRGIIILKTHADSVTPFIAFRR